MVSAGNPEKICTNSDYTYSNTGCTSGYSGRSMYQPAYNMSKDSVKFCNALYAYNGVCDENSSWAFGWQNEDLYMTFGQYLSDLWNYCHNVDTCTFLGNDLLFNGAPYYFANDYGGMLIAIHPSNRYLMPETTSQPLWGLRPVIRLAPTVMAVGGTGTMADPYQISN